MKNKALFLDRDGVVNIDYGFVYHPENFHFLKGFFELCLHFQYINYKIIIITNQSGIARGYFTEEDLKKLHKYMIDKLRCENIYITDIFYCTSVDETHPDRKPNPGLFLKAKEKYKLDMPSSLSIGDKERDIIAAKKAGVGLNILLTDNTETTTVAEYKINNLLEVLSLCIS